MRYGSKDQFPLFLAKDPAFWFLVNFGKICTPFLQSGVLSSWILSFQILENLKLFYLQRFWSIQLRLYVGRTSQLTHSHKHIIFVYFESIGAPPNVLNRRILLTTVVRRPWFSFFYRYYHKHNIFARSLHYFIIFNTCFDCVHRDRA